MDRVASSFVRVGPLVSHLLALFVVPISLTDEEKAALIDLLVGTIKRPVPPIAAHQRASRYFDKTETRRAVAAR